MEVRCFLTRWIAEVNLSQQEQIDSLLNELKPTCATYGELIKKLSCIKKSLAYNINTQNMVHLIEMAMSQIDDEKNSLLIEEKVAARTTTAVNDVVRQIKEKLEKNF